MASWGVTLAKTKAMAWIRADCWVLGRCVGTLCFAPHFLDGIQIRGVGRQKENLGSGLRNQGEGQLTLYAGRGCP